MDWFESLSADYPLQIAPDPILGHVRFMLIEFSLQNFRSYRTRQTLNLVASNYDKSLPENVMPLELKGLGKIGLLKAVALYGPNAGGKSNLIKGLQLLCWLVRFSATEVSPNQGLPDEAFALRPNSKDEPTVFEVTFIAEGVRYEFAVAVSSSRVVEERLVAYPEGRAQVWYDRSWSEESGQYEWSPANPTDFRRDPGIVEKTRPNALFLSAAAQWNNGQVLPVYRWFSERLKFLNLSATGSVDHTFTARLISQSAEFRRQVATLLRSADIGLLDVESQEVEAPRDVFRKAMEMLEQETGRQLFPKSQWNLSFHHGGADGQSFRMDQDHESAGTLRFFSLIGPISDVVANRLVAGIDELDTSLHPTLVAESLRLLFRSSVQNPGAQLIFTTHNPLLLDTTLLRRDQIWFADKDNEGASFLYPLTDYKPRSDELLVRGYMSGRYGAVPFIPRGLIVEDAPAALEPSKEPVHAS